MINPGQLKIVKSILSKYVPHVEVRAFGSRVNGTAKKHSDLDLAIMTSEPLPIQVMADIKHAFSESDLPFKVDVLDWSATGKNFQKIISQGRCEIVQQGNR